MTNDPSIRPGLELRWPATYTGIAQELAYKPRYTQVAHTPKLTHTIDRLIPPNQ